MVHGQHDIGIFQVFRLENGISRQRPGKMNTFSAQFVQCRGNGFDFFATNVAVFTGMRIKTTHIDMRLGDIKFKLQIGMNDMNNFVQALAGNCPGNIF